MSPQERQWRNAGFALAAFMLALTIVLLVFG